jgi:hypothetical protein
MSVFSLKKFTADAVQTGQREIITAPLWSKQQAALSQIHSSSAQSDNEKRYYYEVFNSQSNEKGSEPQFAVAYGDVQGSGSSTGSFGINVYDYPTKAIYSQYKQLLLSPGQNLFKFQNDETSEYIYVINVNRARFKDRMNTNTWQLSLAELNVSGLPSSSNKVINLIDDSGAPTTELATQGGRVYYIRSGSINDGIYTADTTPWGLFYPDFGVIVLNGRALDASASFTTRRSPATGSGDDSAFKLFTSISGAMSLNPVSHSFQGSTNEVVASSYYFVRMLNNEFNFTNNPSFFTGSNQLKHARMYDDPKVYLTTVGLYDDFQNLLAVAKLSQPIEKSFDREVVVKVKLDY